MSTLVALTGMGAATRGAHDLRRGHRRTPSAPPALQSTVAVLRKETVAEELARAESASLPTRPKMHIRRASEPAKLGFLVFDEIAEESPRPQSPQSVLPQQNVPQKRTSWAKRLTLSSKKLLRLSGA